MFHYKVILQLACVIIVAILVFLFVVPYIMAAIGSVNPLLFDILEEVRCHIFQRHGMCLSLYPNPAKVDEVVDVTIRTRRWYDGQQACLCKISNIVGGVCPDIICCTGDIANGKCKTSFKASVDSAGEYFSFLNDKRDKLWEEGEMVGESRVLDINLE